VLNAMQTLGKQDHVYREQAQRVLRVMVLPCITGNINAGRKLPGCTRKFWPEGRKLCLTIQNPGA